MKKLINKVKTKIAVNRLRRDIRRCEGMSYTLLHKNAPKNTQVIVSDPHGQTAFEDYLLDEKATTPKTHFVRKLTESERSSVLAWAQKEMEINALALGVILHFVTELTIDEVCAFRWRDYTPDYGITVAWKLEVNGELSAPPNGQPPYRCVPSSGYVDMILHEWKLHLRGGVPPHRAFVVSSDGSGKKADPGELLELCRRALIEGTKEKQTR